MHLSKLPWAPQALVLYLHFIYQLSFKISPICRQPKVIPTSLPLRLTLMLLHLLSLLYLQVPFTLPHRVASVLNPIQQHTVCPHIPLCRCLLHPFPHYMLVSYSLYRRLVPLSSNGQDSLVFLHHKLSKWEVGWDSEVFICLWWVSTSPPSKR